MTDVELAIGDGILLLEAERQLDLVKRQLEQKTVEAERLLQRNVELHEVATDLWLYGTARRNESRRFKEAVEAFEVLDEKIEQEKPIV